MATSERMLAVLDLFTVQFPDWSVDDAMVRLSLTKSTAYRYFNSLANAGLLVQFATGRYILGPAIIRYDWQLRHTDPLILASLPEMDRLAALENGKAVAVVCRLLGDEVICVHQASVGAPPFGVSYERGRPMPLFAGSASKIILANLTARRLRSLYNKRSAEFAKGGLGETWAETLGELRKIRSKGYCVGTGEVDPGVRGVSVPIAGPGGVVLGSLTIAGPRKHLSNATVERLSEHLRASATAIESNVHRLMISRTGRS